MSRWWKLNDDWDQDKASDGYSRLGVYLTQKLHQLDEPFYDDGPDGVDVEWVCWCWDTATPPVMSPGYVSWDHPVANTRLFREEWEGRLAAKVTVLTKVHLGPGWHTWQEELGGQWVEPEASVSARQPVALGEVVLTAPLDLSDMLRPGSPPDIALVPEVKDVLRRVTNALDRRFSEAVDQLAGAALVP